MSGRKRFPSTPLSIERIYEGEFKEFRDQRYFTLDGEDVPRVSIGGVVVSRYDGETRKNRKFSSITLDDGTDTIRVKVWSRPKKDEEGNIIFDPYQYLEGIEVGHLVEVIGRVSEYEGEFFVSPSATSFTDDMEWEIHRRVQQIQKFMEEQDLLQDEQEPTFPSNNDSYPDDDPSGEDDTIDFEDLIDQVLDALQADVQQNSIELLASRSGIPEDQVKEIITQLRIEGRIYTPSPDRFERVPGM